MVNTNSSFPQEELKSFKDTANYLFEIRKIPSIIDMRYKDGVALKYGK